jgi:hypothetical protein
LRVVAALALSPAARDLLAEEVNAEIVDIRDAAGSEELVLSPAVSWQLIGKLCRAFPQASVLIVEVDDEDIGMAYPGPVMRSLRAGAHGYYVGESVTALGAFIRAKAGVRASAGTAAPALEPGEDELDAVIEEIIRRQPATARRPERD